MAGIVLAEYAFIQFKIDIISTNVIVLYNFVYSHLLNKNNDMFWGKMEGCCKTYADSHNLLSKITLVGIRLKGK